MDYKPRHKYSLDIFDNNDVKPSWNSVKVGWEIGCLDTNGIAKFACDYLETHPHCVNKYISELIFGVKEYEMENYIKNIYGSLHINYPQVETSQWNIEWRKWRFCIMSEACKKNLSQEELLSEIEGIYADFGYPTDMIPFIYYMPSEERDSIDHLTPDEARRRLVDKLNQFLVEERRNIENNCDTLPSKMY